MKADLKNKSRKELEKLRRDVDRALDRLTGIEKRAALAAARKAAQAHGFSLDDLTGTPGKKPAKSEAEKKPRAKNNSDGRAKVAAKFKNPADPSQKWSGRGRKPKWVVSHLDGGGALEDLAI